ncbi:MAG: sulfite exporter TauE/SafE family protein [Crocinitomicaceae bacterium]
MTINTIIILVFIGVAAGILSGFVGIGGGVVIVPALIYFFGMSQMEAQGTSLFLMLPPIGILAVMNYYRTGNVNVWYGIIIACTFVIGGYFGSKISLRISPSTVKIIFGTFMLYVAFKMILSGWQGIQSK